MFSVNRSRSMSWQNFDVSKLITMEIQRWVLVTKYKWWCEFYMWSHDGHNSINCKLSLVFLQKHLILDENVLVCNSPIFGEFLSDTIKILRCSCVGWTAMNFEAETSKSEFDASGTQKLIAFKYSFWYILDAD